MIHPERQMVPTQSSHTALKNITDFFLIHLASWWWGAELILLQRSVSKHDSVQGQGSGNWLLLNKFYESKAGRLGLVSGHSDKLDVSHLLEELHQLLCSRGLMKKKKCFKKNSKAVYKRRSDKERRGSLQSPSGSFAFCRSLSTT